MKNSYLSNITIHMVSSLDGFVAKLDGSVDWMQSKDHFEPGTALTPKYVETYLRGIDAYLMGSNTYQLAIQLGWPYGDKPAYVLTSQELTAHHSQVYFHNGDLQTLLQNHLQAAHPNLWIVGGPQVIKKSLQLDLADRIVVSILPVILGDGVLFFDFVGRQIDLHLEDVTAFKDGMVDLSYAIRS
ncbi:MAG: dihydrofolate reductase family protein [Saprospiraceae bacterium]|nr:dihydrofolate reductase family protein [Saprospiraceae bacterium]